MYAYVKGILMDKEPENAVVEVNGMGINVKISTGTAAILPPVGEPVKLYTYTSVREDAISLYGFLTKDDLNIFKLLIGVGGIGPKGGQSILSVMSPDELRFAILSGDAKMISKAPGIGAKTAQRVIIDLKDKVSLEDTLHGETAESSVVSMTGPGTQVKEAVEALTALGYGSTEALQAVKMIEHVEDMDVETILKAALKNLLR